jgi:hypothetical protein
VVLGRWELQLGVVECLYKGKQGAATRPRIEHEGGRSWHLGVVGCLREEGRDPRSVPGLCCLDAGERHSVATVRIRSDPAGRAAAGAWRLARTRFTAQPAQRARPVVKSKNANKRVMGTAKVR